MRRNEAFVDVMFEWEDSQTFSEHDAAAIFSNFWDRFPESTRQRFLPLIKKYPICIKRMLEQAQLTNTEMGLLSE